MVFPCSFGQNFNLVSTNQKISVSLFNRKNSDIGEISAERFERNKTVALDFMRDGIKYRPMIKAGEIHDKEFSTRFMVVDKTSSINVKLLRRGGFVATLVPIK